MKRLLDGDANGMRSLKVIRDLKDNLKLLIGSPE